MNKRMKKKQWAVLCKKIKRKMKHVRGYVVLQNRISDEAVEKLKGHYERR